MKSQFDVYADAYEASIDAMPFRRYIEMYSIFKTIGDIKGLTVLDMGCGSGLYARALSKSGAARTFGIDCAQNMLNAAKEHEQRDPLGIDYSLFDTAHPDKNERLIMKHQCDLIVSVYALPYALNQTELTGFCKTAKLALKKMGEDL